MKISFWLLSLSLVCLYSCKHESTHTKEMSTFTVSLPEVKDFTFNKEYIGQVSSIQHIELRALEEGYLQNIYVDEGQRVKKGQLLFQISPIIYQAEKQKAQAEYQHAKIEYQNTKILADSNIVSKNELALANAILEKANAELSLADAHLHFTEIRAPFDGIIGRFNDVRLGSLVEVGELLTTLSDNSKMWVYFNVTEAVYLDFIKHNNVNDPKQAVNLKLANGELFDQPGIVETIESDFNNETGNIAFRATFRNPKAILRHGQTGMIYMPVLLKDALLIPQKASFEVLDKKFVFVVKNGNVESRQITVSNEIPHLYEVSEGLTSQDTILIEGLRKVKNGDKIHSKFIKQADIIHELTQIEAE
ncbi:MAG: efflux RND transporter periplasmic adaptor subunit [Saprospiraceae bacterium]|nr:efflux RND transporter periplasmic adaptor subunit [Saprospiraceae bacterium]